MPMKSQPRCDTVGKDVKHGVFMTKWILILSAVANMIAFGAGLAVIKVPYIHGLAKFAIEKKNGSDNARIVQEEYDNPDIVEEEEEEDDEEEEDEEEEEEEGGDDIIPRYFPGSSHQVMVEIRGVKRSFLQSEEQIVRAMTKVVGNSSLSILSYHCHHYNSTFGISCIGVLSERSHITFKTWLGDKPGENVIVIDLLSSGPHQCDIVDEFLSKIESEFALNPKAKDEPLEQHLWPNFRWNIKLRSFLDVKGELRNHFWEDLGERFLSNINLIKIPVGSATSPFQQIDVYDFIDPKRTSYESYFRSLTQDNSYEGLHPELFSPNRIIFLDGVSQSLGKGTEAYHEALVQPAMFAHEHPRRVAIIGGGEGATLREALKHKSVEKVVMIDIDEIMCKESARLLYPDWNGCDDFPNSTPSCFDDPRADVRYEDALSWFIDRYGGGTCVECDGDEDEDEDESSDDESLHDGAPEKFDVIVCDALDPEDTVEFANVLYKNTVFWQSLYDALTDDGVLVIQLGMSASLVDPPDTFKKKDRKVQVIKTLENVGFKSNHAYDETHCAFEFPWTFLVACKSDVCRSNWYRNTAEMELAIHERIYPSKSGLPLLKHFDGPIMATYQMPHKAEETVFCRMSPAPEECKFAKGILPNLGAVSTDAFNVQRDSQGNIESISAVVDIPKFSSVDDGNTIRFSARTSELISSINKSGIADLSSLTNFIKSGGIPLIKGEDELYLSTGVPLLTKNNAKSNIIPIGLLLNQTDLVLGTTESFSSSINEVALSASRYSPVVARHLPLLGHFMSISDISRGEEVFAKRSIFN